MYIDKSININRICNNMLEDKTLLPLQQLTTVTHPEKQGVIDNSVTASLKVRILLRIASKILHPRNTTV